MYLDRVPTMLEKVPAFCINKTRNFLCLVVLSRAVFKYYLDLVIMLQTRILYLRQLLNSLCVREILTLVKSNFQLLMLIIHLQIYYKKHHLLLLSIVALQQEMGLETRVLDHILLKLSEKLRGEKRQGHFQTVLVQFFFQLI